MSYSFGKTKLFFKKQLWVWPIVGVLLLAGIGLYVRSAVESTMRASLQSELQTLLDVEKAMLLTWLESQEANAVSTANDIDLRTNAHALLAQLEATDTVTMGSEATVPGETSVAPEAPVTIGSEDLAADPEAVAPPLLYYLKLH